MIVITRGRTVRTGSEADFLRAREEFERTGCTKLSALLDDDLLRLLLSAADAADFYHRVHEGVGTEMCLVPGPLSGALELMFNDRVLLDLAAELTGCGPCGCFEGRLYRLVPGTEHHDSWHSDVGQDRLAGMSINLGRSEVEGGRLQIRRADSPVILREIANQVAGDAVIFRIDPAYRHRVGPLQGVVPRTAYAGWFRARPDFRTVLREKRSAAGARWTGSAP